MVVDSLSALWPFGLRPLEIAVRCKEWRDRVELKDRELGITILVSIYNTTCSTPCCHDTHYIYRSLDYLSVMLRYSGLFGLVFNSPVQGQVVTLAPSIDLGMI
ncbi:hypothetical protein N7536_011239 [Penicillium majusculum]|nr:hypothetical protein N7536_011239 [Penicillium majusculum]